MRYLVVAMLMVVGCSDAKEGKEATQEPKANLEIGKIKVISPTPETKEVEEESEEDYGVDPFGNNAPSIMPSAYARGRTISARVAKGVDLQPIPEEEIHDSLDLLLAQVGVSEKDLQEDSTAERAALWWVIVKRRGVLRTENDPNTTITDALHAYTANRLNRKCKHTRQCWIQQLNEEGEEPESWPGPPQRPEWSKVRATWMQILREARVFIRGATPDPCPEARHWGGRNIDAPTGRMVRTCQHLKTSNRLYAVDTTKRPENDS